MESIDLGNGPGAEARSIVMNFLGIQKIGIRSLDYEGMVFLGGQFGKPLVEDRHGAKIAQEVIKGLSFDHRKHFIPVHDGVVAGRDDAAFGDGTGEMPGIFFIAVYPDDHLGIALARYQLERRPVLLDGPLGQPEDLLVAVFRSPLVRLLQKKEIAPLIAAAIENYGYAAATLIEGDDVYPLQLLKFLIRSWRFVFTQAKNMSAGRRPLILCSEHEPWPAISKDLKPVREPLVLCAF